MSLKSRTLSVLLPLFCVFALLLFSDIPALAQSASVSGRVIDSSSAVVRKAQITFTDLAKGTAQTTQTNDGGFYSLPFVQPGTYALAVEASGFKRFERTKITVETAQSLVLDVRLQVGDVSQSVTVDGSGAQINTTDASVSTIIDRQFVENIPLNGRSFQSLLTMVPGVSVVPSTGAGQGGEFTVNGQRTEENYFTVDGVSVNTGVQNTGIFQGVGAGYSGSLPGETALGTTQSLVSIDALQEFRATTSTYSAEYGRTPGGQFTFQTRSGTNEWHGSAYDYFRNDALDANNYFNKHTFPITPRQAERQNDFGGTLGGPVRIPWVYNGKDRTFFFFSYEGLRLRNPKAAEVTQVPSLQLRQNAPAALQPFLNAFPVPNGADLGGGLANFTAGYTAPSSLDSSSIRIDHHFSDRFQIFGRYADVPSSSLSRSTSGVSDMANPTTQNVHSKNLTLGMTNTFTSSITSDLRFNFTWNNAATRSTTDEFGGATPLPSDYLNTIGGFSQGGAIGFYLLYGGFDPGLQVSPLVNKQHQLNIVETMNAAVGHHNLRWGIDYRRLLTDGSSPSVQQQAVYFNAAQVTANRTSAYAFLGPAEVAPVYSNFSAFAQDEWKVIPRLSLSLGLRWELNPAPKDANGNNPYGITSIDMTTLALTPQNTPLWHTTYGNFAPRFGMAYQLHQQPGKETVLRVGAGIFYDTGNTSNASEGYTGQGLTTTASFSQSSFPLTQMQIDSIPKPSANAPYQNPIYGFDPNLKLPYTWQWNASLEQALGAMQTVTFSYIGSAGRHLLVPQSYTPTSNPNFGSGGSVVLTTNGASSDYDALQIQFQRKMSHGLQALASYTWAHSIDDATNNFLVDDALLRSDSDNDIRNNFQLGIDYQIPGIYKSRLLVSSLAGWSLDARVSSRSALPVDVLGDLILVPSTGTSQTLHPNRDRTKSLYSYDPAAPGGRSINFSAFSIAKDSQGNEIEGDAGRNSARAFCATQTDLAINRTFPILERWNIQFRAEAFNIFNQAIMGAIYNQLSYGQGMFGYAHNTENNQLGGLNSLYQLGGPRSLQLALKLHF